MTPVPNVHFVQGDIKHDTTFEAVSEALDFQRANIVISDAVPDFMGDRYIDHCRTYELNCAIVDFCQRILQPGGTLLMKIMRGPNEKELTENILMKFRELEKVKPSASRQASAETYYLCKGHEQSINPEARSERRYQEQLELYKDDPEKLSEVYGVKGNELIDKIQKVIEETHLKGMEIPEKLRNFMKNSKTCKQLDIDAKLIADPR